MSRINTNLGDSGTPLTPGPRQPAPGSDMETIAAINRGGGPSTDFATVSSRIDMIARIGLSNRPPRGDYPLESAMGRAAKFAEAGQALLRNFANDMRGVLGDPDLTPIGRQKKMVAVGRDYLQRLDNAVNVASMLPTLKRMLSRADTAVKDSIKLPAPDDLPSMIREREARDILRAMDPSARAAAWQQIVQDGDAVGIAAVVNSPKFARLLPERVVEEGLKVTANTVDPEAAKSRTEAATAVQSVELMYADLRQMIAEASGVDIRPKRQGLAAADAGAVVSA